MKSRERILALLTGACFGAFVLYFVVTGMFLKPSQELSQRATDLRVEIDKLETEVRRETQYRRRVKELAAQTFDADELVASEKSRARLAELLERAGLGDRMSLKPTAGKRVPGVFKEVGWSVRGRGSLPQVIDFLYLVGSDPRLHQLDTLVVAPAGKGGEVDLTVQYATLVLEAPKGQKPPAAGVAAEPLPAPQLDTPQRRAYELIARRDLLRPYVPRSPDAPAAPAVAQQDAPPPTTDTSDAGRLRVVGLPSWQARQDIYLHDRATNQVMVLKPGDNVGGGRIVMVDYRELPLPDKPLITTGSRVVLEFDQELWAVELGRSLAERYRITPQRMPPELRDPQPTDAGPQAAVPKDR